MLRTISYGLLFCALPLTTSAQATISFIFSGRMMASNVQRLYNVQDLGCNPVPAPIPVLMTSTSRVHLLLCKNNAGEGRMRYRNVTTNGSWFIRSFIKDGETVEPY